MSQQGANIAFSLVLCFCTAVDVRSSTSLSHLRVLASLVAKCMIYTSCSVLCVGFFEVNNRFEIYGGCGDFCCDVSLSWSDYHIYQQQR